MGWTLGTGLKIGQVQTLGPGKNSPGTLSNASDYNGLSDYRAFGLTDERTRVRVRDRGSGLGLI